MFYNAALVLNEYPVNTLVVLHYPAQSLFMFQIGHFVGRVKIQVAGQSSIGTVKSKSSVVRAFTCGAMGHRTDPSWCGPIELFLVPASAPRLV